MWCLSIAGDSRRRFYATEAEAEAHAIGEHVVWFDSFDYERHNPEFYQQRLAAERDRGRAYVAELLDELCRSLGFDPAIWRPEVA